MAAEFYINAINVKGEAISEYLAPPAEAFNIEYWLLEEAKPANAQAQSAVRTHRTGNRQCRRRVAKPSLKLADEGAVVIVNDNDMERLANAKTDFTAQYSKDTFTTELLDVTDAGSIRNAFKTAALAFGGVDIVVNCAGLSISKPLEEHTEKDWDLLYDVLVKGQFLVTQEGVNIMRKQEMGGDIINIVSKNALVSGPNNAGYGSAKAAQLHLSRLNAAELGKDHIRVNVVNPDAVISDSKIWAGAWAEGRAKAYGVTVEELPAFYAKRTLLNQIILPEDIANACFAFTGGLLSKSTGNVLNIDGGVAMAFVR